MLIKSFQSPIVTCLVDDMFLIVAEQSGNQTIIHTLNYNNLEQENEFVFEITLLPNGIAIDDSCIYLSTTHGQILCVDKYSRELLYTIDVGYAQISSEILTNDNCLFVTCLTPISSKLKTINNLRHICAFDKTTGQKIAQTATFKGQISNMSLATNNLAITIDQELVLFDQSMQMIHSIKLPGIVDLSHQRINDAVYVFYGNGLVEQYENGEINKRIRIHSSKLNATSYLDFMIWPTSLGIYKITPDLQYHKLTDCRTEISPVYRNERHLICYAYNSLLSIDTISGDVGTKELQINNMKKMLVHENNIYLQSSNSIGCVACDSI